MNVNIFPNLQVVQALETTNLILEDMKVVAHGDLQIIFAIYATKWDSHTNVSEMQINMHQMMVNIQGII